jgi:cobalt/nickel transport system permease protein
MKDFIEKTLLNIQAIYCDLFYSETTAGNSGLMQLFDPRVKLITSLCLILLINLSRTICGMIIMIGYILLLAICSKVPLWRYLWRVSLVAILFTGAIAFPSIFSFVRPGEVLWPITKSIYITQQGFHGALFLMARSFGSLALVYLITATTKWVDILKALHALKIPAVFVNTLEMTHRYLFLGLELAAQLFMARKSRTVAKSTGREGRRFTGAAMGILLIRTVDLTDNVSAAMIARGYNGQIKTLNCFKIGPADFLWTGWNLLFVLGLKLALRL